MDGYCLEEPYFSNKVGRVAFLSSPPACHLSLTNAIPSEAEAVGGHPDEDIKGPLVAAVGTPGNHDECGRSNSSKCGKRHS